MKISRSLKVLAARRRGETAFTMIEIAITLAVIGFALVAIVGILPLGMNVQRENREETIINQDATIFLDAIRNGARGLDDLTNYVLVITNNWVRYDRSYAVAETGVNWYTTTNSSENPSYPITNGFRIIGLLTTPKYIPDHVNGGFISNQVAAVVRAMSGSATEKFPQDNPDSREMGLKYRLVSEVVNFGSPVNETLTNNAHSPGMLNYGAYSDTNSPAYLVRASYNNYATNLYNHLHDVRLIFRWPVLANGTIPARAGRQVYCTTVGGAFVSATDPWNTNLNLLFLQPTTYTTNAL